MSIIRADITPDQVKAEAAPIVASISTDIIHKMNSAIMANLGLDPEPLDVELIKGLVIADILEEFLDNTTTFPEAYDLVRETTMIAAASHILKETPVA